MNYRKFGAKALHFLMTATVLLGTLAPSASAVYAEEVVASQPSSSVVTESSTSEASSSQATSESSESKAETEASSETPASSEVAKGRSKRDTSDSEVQVIPTVLYQDGTTQEDHDADFSWAYTPDGSMTAYIKLDTKNALDNPENVDVTIKVPKKYVEYFRIPPFSIGGQDKTVGKMEDDGTNYSITIHYNTFDKTAVGQFPVTIKFKNGEVPKNYKLPVNGSYTFNGKTEDLNTVYFSLIYKDYSVEKYVNTNDNGSYGRDGAEAYTDQVKNENGVTYVESGEKDEVVFDFRVNGYFATWSGAAVGRNPETLTLTDKLPTYTDKDGNTRTASFDPARNPGWVDNGDGTVSRTFTNPEPNNFNKQGAFIESVVRNAKVRLKFPNAKLDQVKNKGKSDETIYQEINNTVTMRVTPAERYEGEEDYVATDDIKFHLVTKELDGKGSVAKQVANLGNPPRMPDDQAFREGAVEWVNKYNNNLSIPTSNLVIEDHTLDSRLKFTKLKLSFSSYDEVIANVQSLVITAEDGSSQDITSQLKNNGAINGSQDIVLPSDKVWVKAKLVMKPDFEIEPGHILWMHLYTVHKDPSKSIYSEGDDAANTLTNTSNIAFKYGNKTGDYPVSADYRMIPITEESRIKKETWDNQTNNTVGGQMRFPVNFNVQLKSERKNATIKVIDLMPEGMKYVRTDEWGNIVKRDEAGNLMVEVVDNYKNTGRQAVVYTMNTATIMDKNAPSSGMRPVLEITDKALPGTNTNEIFLEITDENGNEIIPTAKGSSDFQVNIGQELFARKFITDADFSNPTTNFRNFTLGQDFGYILRLYNYYDSPTKKLVYIDKLPAISDINTFGTDGRNSENYIHMRGPLDIPEGFKAYYTTDAAVIDMDFAQATDGVNWVETPADWGSVTAIKVVAEGDTAIPAKSYLDVKVPVTNVVTFKPDVMEILDKKFKDNKNGGQVAEVQVNNTFGFTSERSNFIKNSNTVSANLLATAIAIKKVDKENPDTVLEGATFVLRKKGETADYVTKVSGKDGLAVFKYLPAGEYELEETASPDGYIKMEGQIGVSITENLSEGSTAVKFTMPDGSSIEGNGTTTDPFVIANEPEAKKEIKVTKDWDDAKNQDGLRPKSVKVQLKADGTAQGDAVELNEENAWTHTFTGLKEKVNGKVVDYTVEEVETPTGYVATVTGDAATGFTITNTHSPAKVSVKGSKVWKDAENQDGKRPTSIKVQLYANDSPVEGKVETVSADTADKDGNWTFEFKDLPEKAQGEKITYTVKEVEVPAGYEASYSEDSLTITNTHTPETTAIKGKKVWDDSDNQDGKRPEKVTIQLLANGKQVDGKTAELTTTADAEFEFTDLAKYKDGKEIVYSVEEVKVPEGYKSVISGSAADGFVVTNSYAPEETAVNGKKVWVDADNQDGLRPDKITVRLMNGKKEVATKEVTAENNWSFTFDKLAKFENGKEITYTVVEDQVDGYEKPVVAMTDAKTATITNKHVPAVKEVEGKKVWKDADNQDGLRPESITVNLLADGQVIKSVDVKADKEGNWSFSFKDLPVKKAGKDILYTVDEASVPAGYEKAIEGTTITNSHTPELIKIPVRKVWNDKNNAQGLRPEKVTFRLMNGDKEVAKLDLSDKNDWAAEFTDLPKFAKGKEISYTVVEDKVDYYDASKAEVVEGVQTITNTPNVTSIKGVKRWNDNDDAAKKRPAKITVFLVVDNEKVAGSEKEVTAKDNWSFEYKNLPVLKDGKTYQVREEMVPGYEMEWIREKDEDYGSYVEIQNKLIPEKPTTPPGKTILPRTGESMSLVAILIGMMSMILALAVGRRKED